MAFEFSLRERRGGGGNTGQGGFHSAPAVFTGSWDSLLVGFLFVLFFSNPVWSMSLGFFLIFSLERIFLVSFQETYTAGIFPEKKYASVACRQLGCTGHSLSPPAGTAPLSLLVCYQEV